MERNKINFYPSDFEQRIGFDRVRQMAIKNCRMEQSKEIIKNIEFSTNRYKLEKELSCAEEMRSLLLMDEGLPEDGFVDTTFFLSKIRAEGTHLSPQELNALRISLIGVQRVTHFLKKGEGKRYPNLASLCHNIDNHPEIIVQVGQIIDDHCYVKDNASEELLTIRRTISSKEREAQKRINSLLQKAKNSGITDEDANISMRDGMALIPIIASNKKKMKGLVHDESATGKTLYIEPLEVMEINNDIKELQHAEIREVIRILLEFTDGIRPFIDELIAPNEFMALIDSLRAKGRLAVQMSATKPILTDERIINLRSARHPLLEIALKKEKKEIVPLNLKIDNDKHILVISGPNAGGKSVCLKTTAIIQVMAQMGFLIPAGANSELMLFDKIFIDIGDQQSIDNDLSTYSSHLLNMKNILKYSNNKSLILIDEFGTGTEPTLGGAIAETILEKIERKKAFGVITTHYTNIKYYAANAQGVINGAMMFDVQNIKPLFSLEIGKPGSSFAFEIARKIGLPENVVKEAQEKIGKGQINIEKQLREIARDKNYWSNKREKVKISEKKYNKIIADYEEKLTDIKEQRAVIIKQAKKDAEELLSKTNKTIENTICAIKEANAEKEKTKEIRAEFSEFKEAQKDITEEDYRIERKMAKLREREANKKLPKPQKDNKQNATPKPQEKREFRVGDTVRMKGQFVAGEIISIDKKEIMVAFGQLSTSISPKKLEHISNSEFRRQKKNASTTNFGGMTTKSDEKSYNTSDKRLNFKTEIDLRGARVDEAIEIVRIFIDEAIMFEVKDLRILHGKGTGALKEEIRRYLHTIPFVISAKDEKIDFGGSGITVIKLSFD